MAKRNSPEVRYQAMKEEWYFHDSGSYMRGFEAYDGHGCNACVCVPECRYYPKEGGIVDEEVLGSMKTKEQNNLD